MPKFAERLGRVQIAASVQMTIRARELRAQGVDIIQLTIGEPNFASPPIAVEAAHQAALGGQTKYPPQDGLPALKQAIQRKFKRDNGLDFALDEICVTNGGKQAIFNALMATVDPGDETVIPVPSWSAYALMTKLMGGEPVFVNCPQNNGFKPRAEDIDAAITPKTKWLLLNNPNNPTGACCTAEELQAIAAVMRKHKHVWLMSDDMYEHLVFDGMRHATLVEVAPDLRDRTVTVTGASKAYAMTGWRIGFAGGPEPLIKAMAMIQSQSTSNPAAVSQWAAVEALNGPKDFIPKHNKIFKERRDLCVAMLNQAKGITCPKPEGAFYVFPSCAGTIGKTAPTGKKLATDEDFVTELLEAEGVAVVQGTPFGLGPAFRISYATATSSLQDACERIQRFCGNLR